MTRPGFTICICPDATLIAMEIKRALAASPPGGSLAATWERHAYWGDESLPDAFWEHLTLQGLFSTPKAVIVHNAQNLQVDSWKKISAALSTPNSETWPFFCLTVAFERGKPKLPAHLAKLACFAFAEKKGWLWTSPGLDERNKITFIQAEAKKHGLTFAPGAAEAVAARLPLNATTIATEMDKLALAAPASSVLGPEAAEILDREVDVDVFSLLRNLQGGKNTLAVWEQTIAAERGGDALTFSFLATLTREARQLWQISQGESVRLPPQVLTAKTALARSLGLAGIAKIWHLALEADKGVKTGERAPDQALEHLLSSLALLFARR